jgi:hypothetical protein
MIDNTSNDCNNLNKAILFIVFNRLDTTKKVLESIKLAKPPRLYIASDGARSSTDGEKDQVAFVREYILSNIDWECQVETLFRDKNLGCKTAVSNSISWFFDHEEMGIILEDDCLPHPTFYRYCQELLDKYKNDHRIAMISGNNFQFGYKLNTDSYYLSKNNHIWGWASWKDRWVNDYDINMTLWPIIKDENRVSELFDSKEEQKYHHKIFDKVINNEIDTWDYQWNFSSRVNGRATILPNINLVSNIGFGDNASHTKEITEVANMDTQEMNFPLKHPNNFFVSSKLDSRYFNRSNRKNILLKFKNRLKKMFDLLSGEK